MSIYTSVLESLPAISRLGLVASLVDAPPTDPSEMGALTVKIHIRPLRIDFDQRGHKDRHIGAIDLYSPSMGSCWSAGIVLAASLKAGCETLVYDLRPDTLKNGLNLASLKVATFYHTV